MRAYRWGEITPEGISIDHMARDYIGAMLDLSERLASFGWKIVATTPEGIVVEEKDWDRIKDRVTHINEKIYEHHDKILYNEGKLSDHEFSINNLKAMLTLKEDKDLTAAIPIEHGKDITGEFFILFDFLPNEIKKQLKIYIKTEKP